MGSNIDTSYTDSVLADIKVACDKLVEQGLESLVLTVGSDVLYLSGSQMGRNFLKDSNGFIADFMQYCKDCKDKRSSNWADKRFSTHEEKQKKADEVIEVDIPKSEPTKPVLDGVDTTLFDEDTDENDAVTPGFNMTELDGWMDQMIKSEQAHNEGRKKKKSSKLKAKTPKKSRQKKVPVAIKQEQKSSSGDATEAKVLAEEDKKDDVNAAADDEATDREDIKFNCGHCTKSFGTSLELADHIGMLHEKPLEEGSFPCSRCGFQFCYEAHLTEHNIRNPDCIVAVGARKSRDKTAANGLEYKVTVKDSVSGQKKKESLKKLLTVFRCDLPVKCPLCSKTFDKVYPYQSHILTHTNIGLSKCHICLKEMNISSSMPRHFNIHEERPYFCSTCLNRFLNQSRCDHHIKYSCKKTKHRPGLICTECGYQTKSMSHLMQHSKKHTHVESTCDVCGRKFKSLENFLRHKSKAHTSPHQCTICGKTFKQKDSLKKHERDHGPLNYKCEVCGKPWSDLSKLKRHLKTHSGIKLFPFICEVCGQAFSRKTILETHRLLHTGERPFKCDLQGCTKAFRSMSSLKQHKEYHVSYNAFICDFCGRPFKRECMMRHHRKSHTEYQWPCEYCGTKFNGRKRFKTHILTHHIDKVPEIEQKTKLKFFKCTICNKILSQSHVFKEHMAIHRGLKPNKCSYCGKGFSTRSNMRQHERTHTGGKKLRCNLCSKTYNDPKALDAHMKNRHDEQKVVTERKPRIKAAYKDIKPLGLAEIQPPSSALAMNENAVVSTTQQLIPTDRQVVNTSQQLMPIDRQVVITSQQLMSSDMSVVNTSQQLMPSDSPVVNTSQHLMPIDRQVVNTSQQLMPSDCPVVNTSQHLMPIDRQVVDTSQQLMPIDMQVVSSGHQLMPIDRQVVITSQQSDRLVTLMASAQPLELMQTGRPDQPLDLMSAGRPDQPVDVMSADRPMNYSLPPQPQHPSSVHQFVSSFPPLIYND